MKNRKGLLKKALAATFLAGSLFSVKAVAADYSDLWIFGDSFSDNGSTSKILPLLKALKAPPLPANGKLTDDKLWIEFFAEQLGYPHRARTFWKHSSEQPGNFSMIAASSQEDVFAIMDFPEQVDAFATEIGTFDSKDLIVVQIGVNDALEAMKIYGRNREALGNDQAFAKGQAYVKTALESYGEVFERLIRLGGKNFLVVNSPNLGRAPFARQRNIPELAEKYSLILNAEIAKQIANFDSVNIKLFDLYKNLETALANPAGFGLRADLILDKPCGFRGENGIRCTEPEKYFYYDLNHPTTQVNKRIAEEAIKAL